MPPSRPAAPPARSPDGEPPATGGRLSPRLVALLAVTAGAAVANLYYIQPLLDLVARGFEVSEGAAAILVTCAQVGYVIGLVTLVPLGDLVERRRLISVLLLGAAGACLACAAAPRFPALGAALVAVGVLVAVAQIVVPLASSLAAPEERGRVVGTVMSGLLIGILAARTVSGLVAELGGWRLVFGMGAVAMLALSVLLRRALPVLPPANPIPYRDALRSVLTLVAEEPVLRQRMALGSLGFAGFSVLWTSIAFLLSDPPHDYSEGVIGLFGLAGVAGAVVAPLAGRWADRGSGGLVLRVFLVMVLASWALLGLGGTSVVALVAGIVLLDAGMQGAHISNQATIYRLRPEARSRLTTAYMVSNFLGGVVGSLLAGALYEARGWAGVCTIGATIAATAVAISILTRSTGSPRSAHVPAHGAEPAPTPAARPAAGRPASSGEP